MKTLNSEITRNFFVDPDHGFEQLKQRWSEHLAAKKALYAAHFLAYTVLRGRDYRRAFTGVTSQKKLDNGARRFEGFCEARRQLFYAIDGPLGQGPLGIFDGLLTREAYSLLKQLIPDPWYNEKELPEYREVHVPN